MSEQLTLSGAPEGYDAALIAREAAQIPKRLGFLKRRQVVE